MSQKWFNNIDLQQNELQNGVIQNLAADPTSGKAGQIYYNTVDKGYRYHNGTAWVSITAEAVKSIVAGDGLTSSGAGTVTISLGTPSTSGSGSNTYGSNGTTAESHTHQIKLPDATTEAKGVVQLASKAEVDTGTDNSKVVTPYTLGKGKASGVASLDANGKVIASQLPDYLLGQVMYGGNASAVAATTTVSPSDSLKTKKGITATSVSIVNSATSAAANTYGWQDLEGVYFICQASGTFAGISFETGDWIISTGSKWEKIDNTDAVKSVNGQTGVVNITRVDEAANADTATDAISAKYADEAQAVSNQFSFGAFPINISTDNTFDGAVATALRFASPLQVTKSGNTTTVTLPSVVQKYTTTITGDGTTTDFTVQHGLGADVMVQVYLTGSTIGRGTGNELVFVDTYVQDRVTHQIHLVFATAPTASQIFKVVVIG